MQIRRFFAAIERCFPWLGLLSFALLFSSMADAQATVMGNSPHADHWTEAQLSESARAAASHTPDGSISTKLTDYPNHYTMLSLRKKSGGAELHENFADLFLVIEGHATLVTGGRILEAKTSGIGEIRGVSIEGGVSEALKKGDIVHIPAGVPHQLELSGEGEFVYFVVKVKEK